MDMFGYPIQLTYQGESEFKTKTGGCISILIIIVSLCYTAVRFLYMITRTNPDISRYQVVRGYDDAEERYFDPFTKNIFFMAKVDFKNSQGKY